MPRTARVLQFPTREARVELSPEEAADRARNYLETAPADRSAGLTEISLSNPEILLSIFQTLRERADIAPSTTADEAATIHRFLVGSGGKVGVFDERDYFLGTAALLAGGACRLIGKWDDADIWLDKADASFRHTVNPGPALAEVGYARMSMLFDRRCYARVLETVADLVASFEKFGMKRHALKTRFSEAVTLKELSRSDEALEKLSGLTSDPAVQQEPRLMAFVSVYMAELLCGRGRYADAAACCQTAIALQSNDYQPLAMAHLKAVIGEAMRNQGRLTEAVDAYRLAIGEYLQAGVVTYTAYLRVVLSETLVALSRYREAEWEILAALPTIEQHKMVPEGFAAVALLKESVRRRKTDPNALRELREHLQANR